MRANTWIPSAEEEAAIEAGLAQERRQSRQIANMFAAACMCGHVDALCQAVQLMSFAVVGWQLAMRRVARLGEVSTEIREAFIPIWVEHKALPLHVGHRPTMAAALRVLMRGDYAGPELRLYRGTSHFERQRRLYGFSWTTEETVAREFAEQNAKAHGAKPVVLTTVASAAAILLKREPEDYFDEGEVVVDPYRLGRIELFDIFNRG